MKVTPAALAHPEVSPVSSGPGRASRSGHDGTFVQMLHGSLCRSQAASGTAEAEPGALVPLVPHTSVVSPATKAEGAPQPAATAVDYARADGRPAQGLQTVAQPTAAGIHGSPNAQAELHSRESATQAGSRGLNQASPGSTPAGQGSSNRVAQEQGRKLSPESRGAAAGRDSAQGSGSVLPTATERPSLRKDRNAVDGDPEVQQKDNSAGAPETAPSSTTIRPPIQTANLARSARTEDGSTASARGLTTAAAVPTASADGTRAAIPSSPAAVAIGDVAPPATQPAQPAGWASSSLPSLAQSAHENFAASKDSPPSLAGATSRPAKPAFSSPRTTAPSTDSDAQPTADPKASAAPAIEPPAESREGTSVAGAGKRTRAQDGTDDPSVEPAPSLATLVAASNSTTPASHTHSPRPAEKTSAPEHSHALPTREGKQTGERIAPQAPVAPQMAHEHGQDVLRVEAPASNSPPQPLPQVTLATHAAVASGPTSPATGDTRPAAHLPAHAAPLAAQAARDEGLSMTVLPHSAHMAIESPDGDLAVHLRVRQGSAEITVGGSMAHLFEARAPEARAALAGEGLALGRFDSGPQGGGQQGQPAPETPERAGETPAAYRPHQDVSLPATPGEGRIHVTA